MDIKRSKREIARDVIYKTASIVGGGTGAALLLTTDFKLLGVGLVLYGITMYGWSEFYEKH